MTAGNAIVVFIRTTNGQTISSVTSARGATYILVASNTSQDPRMYCYIGVPTSSGTETVTVTLSAGGQYWWVKVLEYSGCGSVAPAGICLAGTTSATSDLTLAGFKTTNNDELIIVAASQAAFATYTAGTDFTLIDGTINDGTNNFGGVQRYANGTTTSSYTAHITSTVTNNGTLVGLTLTGTTRPLLGAWFYPNDSDYSQEGLRITRSDDGKIWFDAIPNCSYTPTNGFNACRNPALRLVSSTYWIAHADSAQSEGYTNDQKHISFASSSDMVTWTPQYRPSFASVGSFSATPRIWAGQWFIDVDNSEHYVFAAEETASSSGFKLWEIHPTTPGDFSTWSTPAQITGTELGSNDIDPKIIYSGGTYYLIFIRSYLTDASPTIVSSASPFSGYDTELYTGNWNGFNSGGEENDQPEIYTINGVDRMYTDQYNAAGLTWADQTAGDWKTGGSTTWSAITAALVYPTRGSATLKAGTILDLTAAAAGHPAVKRMGGVDFAHRVRGPQHSRVW